jgi:hypothetical protein
VRAKVDELLTKIDKITVKYSQALLALSDGNYNEVKQLLSQEYFDEVVRRIMVVDPS